MKQSTCTSATPAAPHKGSQNATGLSWEQSIEEHRWIKNRGSSQMQVISCTAGGGVVVVEVVLVEVLVVLLVVVLVKQLAHLPWQSQGWFSRWNRRRLLLTHRVSALAKSHAPVEVRGTWQTRTQSSSSASAREGISAARAVPAKSFSARRRLSEPSARERARSSKERLVVCWLTCCPHSPKGGTRGLAPPS